MLSCCSPFNAGNRLRQKDFGPLPSRCVLQSKKLARVVLCLYCLSAYGKAQLLILCFIALFRREIKVNRHIAAFSRGQRIIGGGSIACRKLACRAGAYHLVSAFHRYIKTSASPPDTSSRYKR